MTIQFCVIRRIEDQKICCNVAEAGYHYSEYTHQDAYIRQGWADISNCFGEKDLSDEESQAILFESKDKAEKYLLKWGATHRNEFEILSFAEIDVIVEAHLLGNNKEQE